MRAPPNARNPVEVRLVRRIVSLFARCFEHRGRVVAAPLLREKSCSRSLSTKPAILMLFYCALCAAEIKERGSVHTVRPRDAAYRLYGLSTSMTMTTPPRRLGAYLSLCFCQTRRRALLKDLVRIGCVYERIAKYVEGSELLRFFFLYIFII